MNRELSKVWSPSPHSLLPKEKEHTVYHIMKVIDALDNDITAVVYGSDGIAMAMERDNEAVTRTKLRINAVGYWILFKPSSTITSDSDDQSIARTPTST